MVPGSQAGEAAPPAALGLRTLDAAGSAEVRPAAPRWPPMGSAPAPGAVTRKWPLVPRKWPLVARGAQVGVLAGPVRCCRRARASRREPSWTLPAEPAGDPAPPGSGRAQRGCGPRLPRRFPGAVLFFGPSWKQRPSRAPVPPADRAPLAVSDAGAVGVSRCESSLPACLLLSGPEGAGGVVVLLCGRSVWNFPQCASSCARAEGLRLLLERPRVPVCLRFDGPAALLETPETADGEE